MSTPDSGNVMLGRGAVLFQRRNSDGTYSGGFRHLGNCSNFGIGFEVEKLSMRDYTQQTSAPYKEVIVETNISLTITGFEFDPYVFALGVLGDTTTYSQSAATVTDTIVQSTYSNIKGQYFALSKRNVSGVSLTQGTVTAGTADFETFNSLDGVVRIKPAATNLTDGAAVVAVYTAAALSGTAALDVIRGATQAAIEGRLRFVPNNTTGPNWSCDVWNASLTPNGEIGLISDEFNQWTLQGVAQSDAAGNYGGSTSSPYFELTKQA